MNREAKYWNEYALINSGTIQATPRNAICLKSARLHLYACRVSFLALVPVRTMHEARIVAIRVAALALSKDKEWDSR